MLHSNCRSTEGLIQARETSLADTYSARRLLRRPARTLAWDAHRVPRTPGRLGSSANRGVWIYRVRCLGEQMFEVLHRGPDVGRQRGERLFHLRVVKVFSCTACRVEPTVFGPCRKLGFSTACDKTRNAGARDRKEG